MTQVENRQAGAVEVLRPEVSETDIIRREVTDAMVLAGVRALGQWQERKDAGERVTKADLVSSIYALMRRSQETEADFRRPGLGS